MADPVTKTPDALAQTLAGGYSGLNSLAFGAPELIQNLITNNPNSFKQSVAAGEVPSGIMGLKANDIGNVGGLLGSMFIPGGVFTKALGAGAKAVGAAKTGEALAKTGQFLGGAGAKTLGQNFARGTGQALEQAIPRAVIGTGNEVDQGQSLPTALGNEAIGLGSSALLGGGIGAGLGQLGKVGKFFTGDPGQIAQAAAKGEKGQYGLFPQDIVGELQNQSAKQAAGQLLGVNSRIGRWFQNLGPEFEKGPIGQALGLRNSVQKLNDFMANTGMKNLPDIEAYHNNQIKPTFDQIASSINRNNTDFPLTPADVTVRMPKGYQEGKHIPADEIPSPVRTVVNPEKPVNPTGGRNISNVETKQAPVTKPVTGSEADIGEASSELNAVRPRSEAEMNKADTVEVINTPSWLKKDARFQDWVNTLGKERAGKTLDAYMRKVAGELGQMSEKAKQTGIAEASGEDPMGQLWNILSRDENGFRMGQDPFLQEQAILAGKMKDALSKHALDVAPEGSIKFPPYTGGTKEGLNKIYNQLSLFRLADRMDASNMQPILPQGSDTQMKLMMQNMALPLTGAGLGGAAGVAQSDPNNPMGAFASGIAGATLGGLAASGARAGMNRLVGEQALNLNQKLQNPEFAQKIVGARNLIAGQNPAMVPGAAAKAPLLARAGGPTAMAQGPGGPPPVAQGPQQMGPQDQNGASMVQQGPPPGAGAQALQNLGQYGQQLQGKLMMMYNQLNRVGGAMEKQGITPQVFLDMAAQSSNGFDPTITANLLFPDEGMRGKFLDSYQKVQQLKSVNTDAIVNSNILSGFGGSILNPNYAAARQQFATILPSTLDQGKINTILKQLDGITTGMYSKQMKTQMLANLAQNALGIDRAQISGLGLDKGTILEALPTQ